LVPTQPKPEAQKRAWRFDAPTRLAGVVEESKRHTFEAKLEALVQGAALASRRLWR